MSKKLPDDIKKLLKKIEYDGIEYALLSSNCDALKDVDKKLFYAIIEYREGYNKIIEIFKNKYGIDNILNSGIDYNEDK